MEALLALGAFVAVTVVAGRLVSKAIFGAGKRLRRSRWRKGSLPAWEAGVERAGGTIKEAIHDDDDAVMGITVGFDGVEITVQKRLTKAGAGAGGGDGADGASGADGTDETDGTGETDGRGWTAEPYTELTASGIEAPLVFELRDWTRTVGLPRDLGIDARGVTLDDPRLDHFMTAKASNEDLLRTWLERGELRNELAGLRDYAFIQGGDQLLVARPGWETDVELFASALAVTRDLAARNDDLLRQCRFLARELGGKAHIESGKIVVDERLLELHRQGVHITISLRRRPPRTHDGAPRLWTEVEATAVGRDSERWVVYRGDLPEEVIREPQWADLYDAVRAERELRSPYHVLSSDPDQTEGRLSGDICDDLIELAPRLLLVSSEKLMLRLPGLVLGRRKLTKAVELVRELYVPITVGPYR